MEISIKDVENLAALSALEFSEQEKQEFVKDFSNILEMVNKIQSAQNHPQQPKVVSLTFHLLLII